MLELDTDALEAVRTCRQRLRKPSKSADDYLATVLQQGLPETFSFLRNRTSMV